VWNIAESAIHRSLEVEEFDPLSVAFSSDGNLLATGTVDGTIWIWNMEDGSLYSRWGQVNPRDHDYGFFYNHNLVFLPDGKLLASGWSSYRWYTGDSSPLFFWRLTDGSLVHEIPNIYKTSFASDNSFFVSLRNENKISEIGLWGLVR
jgi:WD40 repeat protein